MGGLTPVCFGSDTVWPKNPVKNPSGPNPIFRVQDPRLRLRDGFPTSAEEGNSTKGTLKEIIYHNATEWQVIDPMCEIFHGPNGMPFEFYVDFSRHRLYEDDRTHRRTQLACYC